MDFLISVLPACWKNFRKPGISSSEPSQRWWSKGKAKHLTPQGQLTELLSSERKGINKRTGMSGDFSGTWNYNSTDSITVFQGCASTVHGKRPVFLPRAEIRTNSKPEYPPEPKWDWSPVTTSIPAALSPPRRASLGYIPTKRTKPSPNRPKWGTTGGWELKENRDTCRIPSHLKWENSLLGGDGARWGIWKWRNPSCRRNLWKFLEAKNVQDCTALGSSWDTPTNQPKGPKASPEAHGGWPPLSPHSLPAGHLVDSADSGPRCCPCAYLTGGGPAGLELVTISLR